MKPTQNNAEKKTVLFVDDEKMILEVGSLMLQRLGYNVLTTSFCNFGYADAGYEW
jgi:response regulator RpfG family c-di-GMP phosphodiesterase